MTTLGKISDKATGELVATLPYSFELLPPAAGKVVRRTSLRVDVPWRMGMEWQRDNRTLVLELNDGQFVDFAVTQVSHDSIVVKALGGPREMR